MENEQPADLFSLTLLNWCASWSHRPFINLLYLLDFLILPTLSIVSICYSNLTIEARLPK